MYKSYLRGYIKVSVGKLLLKYRNFDSFCNKNMIKRSDHQNTTNICMKTLSPFTHTHINTQSLPEIKLDRLVRMQEELS